MSVNSKVIETPFIVGVAMSGIEVKINARITVRETELSLAKLKIEITKDTFKKKVQNYIERFRNVV